MGRNYRTITIDQAKALAAQWKAQYEEHLRTVEIATRFKEHVGDRPEGARPETIASRLRRAGGTVVGAIRRLSPNDNDDDNEPAASKPADPKPQDDDMLSPRDVVRITGLSLSTIKRMFNDGRFPKPLHLSPRRIGWPARQVKDWLRTLQDQSRSTRQ